MRHGQDQFDTAGTAAHHHHVDRTRECPDLVLQLAPVLQEQVNRLDRRCMLRGTRHRRQRRTGADIDRHQVELPFPAAAKRHIARQIELLDIGLHQRRARLRGQRRQIDQALPGAVMSGNQAGQHARVSGCQGARQQCDLEPSVPRGSSFAQGLEHEQMGVAAADQEQSFRCCCGHEGPRWK